MWVLKTDYFNVINKLVKSHSITQFKWWWNVIKHTLKMKWIYVLILIIKYCMNYKQWNIACCITVNEDH